MIRSNNRFPGGRPVPQDLCTSPWLRAPAVLGLPGTMTMRIAIKDLLLCVNNVLEVCMELQRQKRKGGGGGESYQSALICPISTSSQFLFSNITRFALSRLPTATTLSQTSSGPTGTTANRCLSCLLKVTLQTTHPSAYSLLLAGRGPSRIETAFPSLPLLHR